MIQINLLFFLYCCQKVLCFLPIKLRILFTLYKIQGSATRAPYAAKAREFSGLKHLRSVFVPAQHTQLYFLACCEMRSLTEFAMPISLDLLACRTASPHSSVGQGCVKLAFSGKATAPTLKQNILE